MTRSEDKRRHSALLKLLDTKQRTMATTRYDWWPLLKWLDVMTDDFLERVKTGAFKAPADKKAARELALLFFVSREELLNRVELDGMVQRARSALTPVPKEPSARRR